MKLFKLLIIALTFTLVSCCALSVDTDAQMYVSKVEYVRTNVYKYTVRATGSTGPYDYLILYTNQSIYKVGDVVRFYTVEKEKK